jgi:hypothetical protein
MPVIGRIAESADKYGLFGELGNRFGNTPRS